MKPIRFGGQVAVVTGAGRGLGRAYALLLGERGAHVVVHDAGVGADGRGADRSVAESVEQEIGERGGSAEASFEDLAVRGAAAKLIERIHRRHGRLDVLIHSAGISSRADLAALDDRDLDRILAINGRAAIELIRAAFPRMADGGYGRIVLTVSGHGLSTQAATPTSSPTASPRRCSSG
jgi:NAD(P)-dependent dehydrogenase (short-subunit alcohol dehydrogenase family)